MHKSTHGAVDYFIKTMLRNVKNALFLHDIAQATWGRCIFIAYRKILQNSKHLPSIYNNKVTVNFFSGHPVLYMVTNVQQPDVTRRGQFEDGWFKHQLMPALILSSVLPIYPILLYEPSQLHYKCRSNHHMVNVDVIALPSGMLWSRGVAVMYVNNLNGYQLRCTSCC